jgi:hypothetical protein
MTPTPTWHLEAIEQGLHFIVLVYEKAEGFVFCPTNLECPFRVGGDYNGNLPTSAEGALNYLNSHFHSAFHDRIEWFIPFLNKVAQRDDFSLVDLQLETRSVRLIKGPWPW